MADFGLDQPRFYRLWGKADALVSFEAKYKETDLYIKCSKDLKKESLDSIKRHRHALEEFIKKHPKYKEALTPYPISADMAPIVREMARAAGRVGVGPMAAVAGAVAQYVGMDLLKRSDEVIVENGGDIFLKVKRDIKIGIFAADSPFTKKIAIQIRGTETPLGICTSSGTVGPSLSLGKSDAAIVLSKSTIFADACATAAGNMIKEKSDIEEVIEYAKGLEDIYGIILIKQDKMGVWGTVTLS